MNDQAQPWHPFGDVLLRVSDRVTTAEAVEARKLHDALQTAHKYHSQVREESRQAFAEASTYHARASKLIADAVNRRDKLSVVIKQVAPLDPARATFEREMRKAFLDRAAEIVKDAENALIDHLQKHWRGLVETHKKDAENIAHRWATERDRFKLPDIEKEHDQIRDSVLNIIGRIEPFTTDDVPSEYGKSPYPTDEAFKRYKRHQEGYRSIIADQVHETPQEQGTPLIPA